MSPAPDPTPDPLYEKGQRIRQYELLSELGRGGMGVVYRAKDVDLARDVALKCPFRDLATDPREQQRVLQEARTAARLTHPNIVPLFEAFEEDGRPWLVMQLVDGDSLRDRLGQDGPLALPQVLQLGEDIAAALEFAHGKNVLHRDVSPKNILVAGDGRGLLTDFGLARFLDPADWSADDSTQPLAATSVGAIAGTPPYMSPEQCLGRPLDERSDIFSFGAVLYEMCTGQRAFHRTDYGDVLDAVMHREPEPISRFTYEVPAEFERIVRKAMAKAPDERYQSAGEMLVDLRALRRELEFKDYSGSHPGLRPAPDGAPRLPRALVAGLATVAALVVAVVAWRAATGGGRDRPIPAVQPTQVTSTRAWEGEPVISPDGGRIAYASDLADNFDIYVVDVHGGSPLQLTRHPATDGQPVWFPDGSALAFLSDRSGEFAIWRVGQMGGSPTLLIPNASDPSLSPAGTHIAFARNEPQGVTRIGVASLADPLTVDILTTDEDGAWDHLSPAWSPNGSEICYSTRSNLWLVPADGGPAHPLTTDGEFDLEPAWSWDGRFVYFASYREGTHALWRVAADGGAPSRVTLGTGPESHASISADGSRLAYCTTRRDHDVVVLDRQSGDELVLAGERSDWMPTVASDFVVFVSNRDGPYELWRADVGSLDTDPEPRRITGHAGDASHPKLSPDGRWIAYYRILDGQRDIWTIPPEGGEALRFTEHPGADIHPAWSPDGERLAFSSEREDGTHIWVADVRDGRRTGSPRRVTSGEVVGLAPAWSPDGSSIAFVNDVQGHPEAWVVPADGSSPAKPVVTSVEVQRVGWDAVTGDLLVSGSWSEGRVALRRVSRDGQSAEAFDPRVDFGVRTGYESFDLARDGRLLVYCRARLRGDVWVLDAKPHSF